MISEEELRDRLRKYLPNIRWWPWKGEYREISFLKYFSTDIGVYTIFKADQLVFQLPLIHVHRKPVHLENRYIRYREGYLVEAEYTPKYLELMSMVDEVSYREYGRIEGRVIEAKPITLGSTNAVAEHFLSNGLSIVVKSYRILPKVNLEPLMITRLAVKGYKNIPRLYRTYVYRENTYLSIVTGKVYGYGDGGTPFYNKLIEYFENVEKGARVSINKYTATDLARRLGAIIADMHIKIHGEDDEFYSLETIGERDIRRWSKRIDERVEFIRNKLDEMIKNSKSKERSRIEYWLTVFNKVSDDVVEKTISLMENVFRDTYMGRVHQDLHLAQMIYNPVEKNFIITDFEGEPGRSDDERILKEPLVRDLATMATSFHYLSFTALHHATGNVSYEHIARKLVKQKIPLILKWSRIHLLNMIYRYSFETMPERIGRDLFNYGSKPLTRYPVRYIAPWIIERTLYEIFYELKYRPEWFVIPLTALVHQILPLVES